MSEKLQFEEVSIKEWVERMKEGFSGLQSGNTNLIYTINGDLVYANGKRHVSMYDIERWIEILDDGWRSFYIIKGDNHED